ncbi:MAG: NAD(P)/FAD-dependent oxidoreductase [Spirochaetota bacterium]|nr:NAD(P)/FAD-dependent oxidoreductase [Spirochaetota bacterium]
MTKRRVVVIGGGAAGLMAAGRAAEAGAKILLLEKMKHPGCKLCITGKGRCNITNIAEYQDFIAHFGKTGTFLHQAFSQFFNIELMSHFNNLGLELVVERGGRVFPASGKSSDVLKVLLQWLERCRVQIQPFSSVVQLLISGGRVTGVISQGRKILCDSVILATGGVSYPNTGSTGDGYCLAISAGHSIVPLRPALVPLETFGNVSKRMAGLNLRNIHVCMLINGKKYREAFGELLFTEFGVAGPVVLSLSGDAVDSMRKGKKVIFSIDLKPALDDKKLDARLLQDLLSRGNENVSSVLRGLLPGKMVPVCLDLTGIPPDRLASNITSKERRDLRRWLKNFQLEIIRHRPITEAIVTAGGIDTREVNPRTMESLKTRGLFIAGELLNINADTGGYNLQAAFSTGWLAGYSAAIAE